MLKLVSSNSEPLDLPPVDCIEALRENARRYRPSLAEEVSDFLAENMLAFTLGFVTGLAAVLIPALILAAVLS
jgi:hypothetical protein